MSRREVDRLDIVQEVAARRLRQATAAQLLGLSVRQVKRLVQRYRARGAAGLVSGHRGRRSNNAIAASVKAAAVELIRERYVDFGPTLAHEKLVEAHGFGVSVETLRQWMIEAQLWRVKPRRAVRVHQRRPRRACLGELVQADGSDHAWFEERGPRCALIVFVDDATSRLLALRFVPSESTAAYMRTLRGYLKAHGRPVALYTDRHGIFRVNQGEGDGGLTQFTRALRTLDIEPIHAHTPQAKGRVERVNGTLQDRLVKELRLRGIDEMESANAFLPTFMADYNARFAVEPASPLDAHRAVLHSEAELDLIFCLHATRKISRNLTFQYARREYQLTVPTPAYGLRGAAVTVCEGFDGTVTVLRGGRVLPYRVLAQGEAPIPLHDEKSVHAAIDRAKARQRARPRYKPSVDHPWNRMARQAVAVAAERTAAR